VKVLQLSLALLLPVLPARAEVSYLRYLEETAREGEAESQFILGLAYRDGWDGTVRNGTIAARWCDLAAEQDDSRPAFVFALLQRERNPVKQDAVAAVKWLNRAAEQGDHYAQVILGEMLLEGNGVPADWRHGAEWITRSARASFAPAQFRLGVLYLIGDASLPKNEIEALAWFIVAAESGSRNAREFRDEQTRLLGVEAARLAVQRSRTLLALLPARVKHPG
jgi:TPR repeat protein